MGAFEFVYTEDGKQQRFDFDSRDLSVGRSPDCDFVLDHPTVSRRHARIVEDGGGRYRLVVLSEKGLTAVDGQKIQGEVELQPGATVYFGKLSFEFRPQGANAGRGPGQTDGSTGGGHGGQASPDQSSARGAPSSASGSGEEQWGGYEDDVTEDPIGVGAAGQSDGGVTDSATGEPDAEGSDQEMRESVGIESWDDIAESAGDDEDEDQQLPGRGDDREEEQTNPLLIVVAVAALGFVIWTYMSGPGMGGGKKDTSILDRDIPPVKIQVDCLAPQKCMRKANQAYEVGTELLEKPGAEITNLFNGYKKLLEVEAYVEKADREGLPKEMNNLEELKKKARKKLDQTFRNFRVKYTSAKKEGDHREMAESLLTIQRYFPDETAREHRWAREQILKMKRRNTYPDRM